MKRVEVLGLSDYDRWEECLYSLPERVRDVYYSAPYAEMEAAHWSACSHCFVYAEGGEIGMYSFLKRPVTGYELISGGTVYYDIESPYGYGGPVASIADEGFIQRFTKEFEGYCSENNIVGEFVRFHPLFENADYCVGYDVSPNRETVVIDVSQSIEDIWNCSYDKKTRNMFRKGGKSGLVVTTETDEAAYGEFVDIYSMAMTRLGAGRSYFFGNAYFDIMRNKLGDRHALLSVRSEGKMLAGAVVMFQDAYAHYHLSARSESCGNNGAMELILNRAVEIAHERGCRLLHLGGGATRLDDDPLLRFKRGFSKQRRQFQIGKKVHNAKMYKALCDEHARRHPDDGNAAQLFFRYREDDA
jgi:hypothetical protein